jgi:alpha,alpha-trehalase
MKSGTQLAVSHRTDFLQEFGELFRDIQMSGIFSDSITFNDCVPRSSAAEILTRYEVEKRWPWFDLADFLLDNFELPDFLPQKYETNPEDSIDTHIASLWSILTREHFAETGSSLIPLPYSYVVPGGRFRGLYYWDSYFTSLGLEEHGRMDLVENMLGNFAFLIDEFGFIPNANRTYYVSRSQPPVFALMIDMLASHKGDTVWDHFLPYLEKEYAFWMKGADTLSSDHPTERRVVRLPNGTLLNRYWDDSDAPRPESYREDIEVGRISRRNTKEVFRHIRAAAESGWDFSSRWFKNGSEMHHIYTTDFLPIDLNCLMLNIEKTLLKQYERLPERSSDALLIASRAQARENMLRELFWSEADGLFMDYDWTSNQRSGVVSLAGIYPLFFGLANSKQSKRCAQTLEQKLLHPGGFVTSLQESGQQWDLPNGWAPLHWIAINGLVRYGHLSLAKEAANRWLSVNRIVFEKTGKLTEKYNMLNRLEDAQGGEYPNQDGFGWTNGVFLKLSRLMRELQ